MSSTQLIALVVTVFPMIVSLAGSLFRSLEENLPSAQRALLDQVIREGVHAAEQVGTQALSGPEKKAQAIDFIEARLKDVHLKVDPKVVEMLLEEAVYQLNQEQASSETETPIGFVPGN